MIRKLQNPPDGCEDAYDSITELFEAYSKLADLALSPSDSLETFVSEKDKTSWELIEAFRKIGTLTPE